VKGRIAKTVSLALMMIFVGTVPAFAGDSSQLNHDPNEAVNTAVEPRSLYLATAISEITNKGNGVLHIYADFTSYESVEWAKLTINLERTKDPGSGKWTKVKTYTYEFNRADEPDGDLIYASADFDAKGFATNYYYRLSCTHKVKTPSGSYETKETQTDGVLLTEYPDFRSVGGDN